MTISVGRAAFAQKFNQHLRESVASIIAAGKVLRDAKESLAHGEFLNMVTNDLPISADTAQRLMAIAGDKRISNTAHDRYLPSAWTTLYELSRLDDATFEQAVESGKITPDMERKDAKALNPVHQRAKAQDGERRAMNTPSDARIAPVSASDTDPATLVQEREEALQNAAELASMLEATQYANAGAEDAANRIMALDQEILALKATNARLQEQNAELMRAVKHWKKLAKAK